MLVWDACDSALNLSMAHAAERRMMDELVTKEDALQVLRLAPLLADLRQLDAVSADYCFSLSPSCLGSRSKYYSD